MKRIIILISIAILVPAAFFFVSSAGDKAPRSREDIYGGTPKIEYLTGRFRPSKHPDFVKLKGTGIPTDEKTHYLRKETAAALKVMVAAFKKDHPRVKLWIRSSTRNFNAQKYIWEKKWKSGRYGGKHDKPVRIAKNILKYSSMPGTSRHHWGTDFDINKLNNSYYKSSNGKIIYTWLRKNAGRFGFCQPYTKEREQGYNEERWHWSYVPLAGKFLKEWNSEFSKRKEYFTKNGNFLGSGKSGYLAPVYVNGINPGCR